MSPTRKQLIYSEILSVLKQAQVDLKEIFVSIDFEKEEGAEIEKFVDLSYNAWKVIQNLYICVDKEKETDFNLETMPNK